MSNTINDALNGMLTVMIAKFMMNDMAHAVGIFDVNAVTDSLGKGIDSGIKRSVALLNRAGLVTTQSCEGHADQPNIAPYVDIRFLNKAASNNLYQAITPEIQRFNVSYNIPAAYSIKPLQPIYNDDTFTSGSWRITTLSSEDAERYTHEQYGTRGAYSDPDYIEREQASRRTFYPHAIFGMSPAAYQQAALTTLNSFVEQLVS